MQGKWECARLIGVMNNTSFTPCDEFVTNSTVTAHIKKAYQNSIDELRMEIRMMEGLDKCPQNDKLLPFYKKALELLLAKAA